MEEPHPAEHGERDHEEEQRGEREATPGKAAVYGMCVLHGRSRFAGPAAAPPSATRARRARIVEHRVFVTFEGADGSGKSTQAELLRAALAEEGREVVLTREPGGTELGERIRELLLAGPQMGAWAEAALFAASRAQHVDEVIRPALERGADVVCDRYVDSSLAYQGIARGLGVEEVLELNLRATGGLLPDVTFLLLVDPQLAAARWTEADRLEQEGDALQAKVDAAYRKLAERFPERIVPVDGAREPGEIAKEVHERLRDRS
jgi:dTMP kinase